MQAARARILLRLPLVWVLLLVLVGGAAGAVVGQLVPRPFRSTAHLYLSSTPATVLDLQEAQHFQQQAAASLAGIATSPQVLRPVIDRLALKTTPAELADEVSASVATGTVVIGITVTDPSAARSAQIANAVTSALVERSRAAMPTNTSASGSRLTVIQVARTSGAEPAPDLASVGIGAAAGLLIALVVLLLRSGRPKPPRGSWRLISVPRSLGEPA